MPRPRKPAKRRRRGSGSVARSPDGSFAAIPPAWLDAGRKPVRGFPSRELAERWLDDACRRARDGPTTPADVTLGEYAVLWFDRIADSADWSPGTRAAVRTRLRMIAGARDTQGRPLAVHQRAVAGLTLGQLQDVIASLTRRGISAAVIGQVASILRRILASAQEDGLVARNVASRLVLPRVRRPEPHAWTRAEVTRLLASVEGEPLEPLVWLGLVLGLRIGELLALSWDDLDMAARTVRVWQTYSAARLGPTKTRRTRTVRLPAPVWAVLLRHRERQQPGERWLFPSPKIKRRIVSYGHARLWLARMVERAEIRTLPSHTMRHSSASAMLSSGVDPADVARQLGHASPATTLGRYWSPSGEGTDPGDVVAGWLEREE